MVIELLQQLLEAGVGGGVFPAAQASVFQDGAEVGRASVGSAEDTPFDLASLTKILCTAPAFVALWAEGKVGPATPVSRWIDESPLAKNGATLGNLLAHRSGLPAWAPFFAVVLHTVPELRRPDCPAATRLSVRSEVRDAAARSPLDSPPGARTVYSDVGFLLAGEMLAEADGVAARLGACPPRRSGSVSPRTSTASPPADRTRATPAGGDGTGCRRPVCSAPGRRRRDRRTAGQSLPTDPSRPGEVDDDNAWVMDGVAGPRRPLRNCHRGRALRAAGARGARRGRAPRPGRALGARGRSCRRAASAGSGSTRRPGIQLGGTPPRTHPAGRLRPPWLHRDEPLGGPRPPGQHRPVHQPDGARTGQRPHPGVPARLPRRRPAGARRCLGQPGSRRCPDP